MLTQIRSPVMVGRDRELARLEATLLAAVRGESRVALITGDAGAGKSRLATEVLQRARSLSMRTLRGECSESDVTLPYRPLVDAFGAHLADPETRARVQATLGDEIQPLTRVMPQLRGDEHFDATGTSLDTLRLFESFVSLARVVAGDGGLVLLIEDVHWVDRATQELLEHLVRRLEACGTVLVMTLRDVDLDREHPLRATVQRWERSAEVVRLQALSIDDVAAMTSAIFDSDETPNDIARRLHERTDGLPFAVEELLRQAMEQGQMPDVGRDGWAAAQLADLPPPRSLTDGILVRSARLERDALAVLRSAAILGRSFEFTALHEMVSLPAETVIDALEQCAGMQLIEEDRSREHGYRFRHVLVRDAVYNDVMLARRRILHGRAADALRATGAGDPAELAHHLIAAGRTEDAAVACADAAELALQRLAPREAAELFTQAQSFATEPLQRARLECCLGEACHAAGEVVTAQLHLEAGIAALEDLGDARQAARHRLTLGRCCWLRSQYADATRHFELARTMLEEHGPSEDLALAYIRLSGLKSFELEADEAVVLADRAVVVADECGCIEQRIAATDWLGLALCLGARFDAGIAELDRSREEARVRGLLATEARVLIHELSVLETYGRAGALQPLLERLKALPDDPWVRVMLPYYQSWAALWSAQLVEAAREARRCADLATGFGMDGQAGWGRAVLCLVATELGDLDAAAQLVPPRGHAQQRQEKLEQGWVTLRLHVATGDLDAAAELASELATEPWALAGMVLTDTVVESLLAGELLDEAAALLDAVAAHPRAAMHPGHLLRAQGRLALARSEGEAAAGLLRAAGDAYVAGGYRLELMRTRALLGAALAAAGDRDGARRTLHVALTDAHSVGAMLIARACESAARTAGVDLGAEPAAAALSLAAAEGSAAPTSAGDVERLGSREVTVLVADVRAAGDQPRGGADPMEALRRWAALAIEQHHGVVDEFAGDVVMATFNVSGRYPAHARQAVEAALELVRTGVRLDRAVAAGIASGDAIIGRVRQSDRVTVVGDAANLAARLHAEAAGGDILLSEASFAALGPNLPAGVGAPARCLVSIAGLESPAAAVRLTLAAPAPPSADAPVAADAPHGRLSREAEFWSMTYGGSVLRLKDAKGVRDLARLLANPGTEIAAVDLAGAAVPVQSSRARAGSDLDLGVEGDAGEVLDERARAEYRQRLIDLEADLADAEDANDPERASRVRQEREFIIDELGAAVGLMGKSRRALDPAERARKAVTWRLRETIGRIEAAQPALGRHLRLSVRTGAFCVYDPATPTRWSVTA